MNLYVTYNMLFSFPQCNIFV